MDIAPILHFMEYAIYWVMGGSALYGVYVAIVLLRRITQKRFFTESSANQFLTQVRDQLQERNFESVAEMCDSPPNWSKAVPQLILVAVSNRQMPMKKLQRMIADQFTREVIADLEYGQSWISAVVKTAPMLGLLGTVVGMINAFAKIATASQQGGLDPGKLAGDISFALFTTFVGLSIAIPLIVLGNMIQVRIGKMQDAVQHHMGIFLDDLESVTAAGQG